MEKILDFAFLRRKKIEQAADDMRYNYVKRSAEVKNRFSGDFYCICSEFAYVDALIYFGEMPYSGNIFYENMERMNKTRWERYFKITAMHNTIRLCLRKRKKLKVSDMKDDMFYIFNFDENEKKFFELMCQMAFSYESRFNAVLPKIIIKYIFGKYEESIAAMAFTENFCYNSYSNLMTYFSRYISVSRRIMLAKQA